MVVVAGHVAGVAVPDLARRVAEGVPDRRAAAVLVAAPSIWYDAVAEPRRKSSVEAEAGVAVVGFVKLKSSVTAAAQPPGSSSHPDGRYQSPCWWRGDSPSPDLLWKPASLTPKMSALTGMIGGEWRGRAARMMPLVWSGRAAVLVPASCVCVSLRRRPQPVVPGEAQVLPISRRTPTTPPRGRRRRGRRVDEVDHRARFFARPTSTPWPRLHWSFILSHHFTHRVAYCDPCGSLGEEAASSTSRVCTSIFVQHVARSDPLMGCP